MGYAEIPLLRRQLLFNPAHFSQHGGQAHHHSDLATGLLTARALSARRTRHAGRDDFAALVGPRCLRLGAQDGARGSFVIAGGYVRDYSVLVANDLLARAQDQPPIYAGASSYGVATKSRRARYLRVWLAAEPQVANDDIEAPGDGKTSSNEAGADCAKSDR